MSKRKVTQMGKDAIVHAGRKSIQRCTSCSIYFQLRAARCISTSGAFRYLFGVRRDGEVDWRGACREKKLLRAQLLRSQNFQPLRSNPFAMDSSQVVLLDISGKCRKPLKCHSCHSEILKPSRNLRQSDKTHFFCVPENLASTEVQARLGGAKWARVVRKDESTILEKITWQSSNASVPFEQPARYAQCSSGHKTPSSNHLGGHCFSVAMPPVE